MEMNTRLQVEHPVTEVRRAFLLPLADSHPTFCLSQAITGVDLVQWQLEVRVTGCSSYVLIFDPERLQGCGREPHSSYTSPAGVHRTRVRVPDLRRKPAKVSPNPAVIVVA